MKIFIKTKSNLNFNSKHLKAEQYKQLCMISDEISKSKSDSIGQFVFDGYEVVAKKYDKKTNFKAVAYRKNNEVIVCFVGTDSKCLKDHLTNLKMGIGKITKQMKLAENFVKQITGKFQSLEIILAGHSEGGSEALYVGLRFGLLTYTYNAFAISQSIIDVAVKNNGGKDYYSLINNYRDAHDPVSKLFNEDVGNTYIVESTQSVFMAKTPFGSKTAHSLKNMGNCENAIPVKIYCREHPLFINKIGKVNAG